MEWLLPVIQWYLFLLGIGLIFAPLAKKIFGSFYDFGYPFAKTLAIIIGSYTVFILGIIKVLPFTREAIFFMFIAYAIFFYYQIIQVKVPFWKRFTIDQIFFFIFEEIMFFAALVLLTFIRGQEPSIRGLEKFMDFGFMQSILRSEYFPPLDMWLSGDPKQQSGYFINYYYFGHLSGSFLIKLSNINPFVGYNLVLATIFAQGITLAFSLTANIVYLFQKYILKLKNIKLLHLFIFGLLGSFLVNLGGNLHTIYLLTTGYEAEKPVPFWTIFQKFPDIVTTMVTNNLSFLDAMQQNSKYWYPNATRFIPYTIHEFPSYSYVVADLHGHVFDIPFVLTTIAVVFSFFMTLTIIHPQLRKKTKAENHPPFLQKLLNSLNHFINKGFNTKYKPFTTYISNYELIFTIFFGFMIAVHYMTNAFDGPIYILFVGIVFLSIYQFSIDLIIAGAILLASFLIFSLPFSAYFVPFVSGIGINCSPKFLMKLNIGHLETTPPSAKIGPFLVEPSNCQVSEPWMLFVLWGFFWISAFLLMIVLFVKKDKKDTQSISPIDFFMLILFAFGTFLIVIPEFFYIKDIYPQHFRANTMFKMGYQAFIMMSIASAFVLYRIKLWNSLFRYVLKAIYLFLFAFIFVYPFLAFPSYYTALNDPKVYEKTPQLDGANWLKTAYPEDREMIDYINAHIKGQPVILEAQGDSYTDYERISSYTGTPTVAGWWVHEWLWRGSPDVVGERVGDIGALYESDDIELTKKFLKKYNISYIVVGNQERTKYPQLKEEKFEQIGTKIFESSNGFGALYKVN